jgi:2,4-dienoyl-CoA reductase (NADPH2)
VTGGFAPNVAGWTKPFGGTLMTSAGARRHRVITDAVHAHDGKIALQILHTGRYGYHPFAVAPSKIKSPISPFAPRELSARGVERQIRAFVRCASSHARPATTASRSWAPRLSDQPVHLDAYQQAHRPVGRCVREPDPAAGRDRRRTREAVGRDFILIYRLSMLDLIPDGSDWVRPCSSRRPSSGGRDDHQHRDRLARGARADHRDRCRAARSRGSRRR